MTFRIFEFHPNAQAYYLRRISKRSVVTLTEVQTVNFPCNSSDGVAAFSAKMVGYFCAAFSWWEGS